MYSDHRDRERRPLSSARLLDGDQDNGTTVKTADNRSLEVEARRQLEQLNEVQGLESDLVELNAAFGEMNQLIAMQDEEIENTLYAADRVQTKVDSGSGRLRDARSKSESHRKNLVFVLVFLFIILGIMGVVILMLLR